MSTFNKDTVLYHAVEGERVFPKGEQHPGASWSDRPGGAVPKLDEAAMQRLLGDHAAELTALSARVAALEARAGHTTERPKKAATVDPEPVAKPNPPDLDGDGKPGGSLPAQDIEDIPADWATLPWFSKRKLAAKFNGGAAPADKDEAHRLIEAELERRKA